VEDIPISDRDNDFAQFVIDDVAERYEAESKFNARGEGS